MIPAQIETAAALRIVIFARGPYWLPLRGDRISRMATANGHEVVAYVVENTGSIAAVQDWTRKLGFKLVASKAKERLARILSSKVASVKSPRTASFPMPAVYRVRDHNSQDTVRLVSSLAPDVILLRGTRILKPSVLAVPKIGTLNAHYGRLPQYRGVDATEWAVFHGEPPAVSVHWVLEGVDSGAVLSSAEVPIEAGDTLGALRDKSAALAVELFSTALSTILRTGARPTLAEAGISRQYYRMHPYLKAMAEQRIAHIGGRRA